MNDPNYDDHDDFYAEARRFIEEVFGPDDTNPCVIRNPGCKFTEKTVHQRSGWPLLWMLRAGHSLRMRPMLWRRRQWSNAVSQRQQCECGGVRIRQGGTEDKDTKQGERTMAMHAKVRLKSGDTITPVRIYRIRGGHRLLVTALRAVWLELQGSYTLLATGQDWRDRCPWDYAITRANTCLVANFWGYSNTKTIAPNE